MSPLGRNYCRWEPSDAFPFRKRTCLPFNHMPRNVTLQRPCNVPFPAPATQSHAPTLPECFNRLPPNVTLVVRLPHIVTLQRTLPCTSHPEPRSNATRMLQSTAPATKCHTGAAPATQRHTATYPSLHQPPGDTLQLEVSRVQAIQFHVYKRANFTCTSEPAPLNSHLKPNFPPFTCYTSFSYTCKNTGYT